MPMFPHNISSPAAPVIELPLATRWMAAALGVQLVMFNEPESSIGVQVLDEGAFWRFFVNTAWPLHVHQLRLFLEAVLTKYGGSRIIPRPDRPPTDENLLRFDSGLVSTTLQAMAYHRN